MARALQALILGAAIAVTAAAQAPPAEQPQRGPKGPVSVTFSHAFHAKLGDIAPILKAARDAGEHLRPEGAEPGPGCLACHAGLAEADQKHRGLPLMGDCLVCHAKVDPPFSCPKCHTQAIAELKPAYHEGSFADNHSRGLAKMGLNKAECAVCHGRKFTCMGCH